MWFLCQEPCKTLDQARKRAMEIGRENFDSIHKECYGLFFKRTVYVVLWWKWIEKEEVKQMERLTERYIDEDDGRESGHIEHRKNFVILLSMINTFFTVKKLEEMKNGL